ncbi:uncharacterized protein LOC117341863 [Pecten maximus]|uniref:uncharacterized protein LOC117341863 n=1 Tax=Pecten maximus TaxID=6579 RepID=UPI0014580F8D|nr:uncharacterized protein LOC117341863 [Pecten maximus]
MDYAAEMPISMNRHKRISYTGGLKAVIWTDVFQAVVMYTGMAAILIKGSIDAGGVKETWRIANENGRINLFNFDPDPTVRHTFWNLLIGSLIHGFGFMFNQSTIQRISATATVRDAKKMWFITAPAFLITMSCAAMEGIVVYAYYHSRGCDPLKSKQISNPNQLIPFMVMDSFHSLPGMPGLFIASLFSASLSTLSSGLSSMSALLYTDIIKPHTKPMSQATIIAKLAVVFFGVLAVGVAFLISYVGGNLVQIASTLLAAFSGPLSGLFLLGCFVPFANAKGAILSTVLSIGLTAWIAAGQFLTKVSRRWKKLPSAPTDQCFVNVNGTLDVFSNYTTSPTAYDATWSYDVTTSGGISEIPRAEGIARLYTISYLWLGVIGILTVIIFGAIFSLMTGPVKPEDANPMYLVSLADKLMCYLPLSIRKRLRHGIDYEQAEKFHVEVDKLDEFVLKTEKEGMEVTYDEHLLSRLSGSGSDDIKCTLCEEPDSVEQFDTCQWRYAVRNLCCCIKCSPVNDITRHPLVLITVIVSHRNVSLVLETTFTSVTMVSSHSFVVWDYVIFGITIVISISIGLYHAFAGGRQKTTSEFLVGNRRMKVLPVAISLMVSFESSIMMLGVPAEVYEYGIQYVLQLISFLIATSLAIHILVPLLHPLKITSAYEYLELRFKSRAVRLTGTVLGITSYTCYIGIVLFGPGVALEAVTGFPQWVSIVIIAAAAILYTSIGGLKAVIWTDVFQAVVMYTGMAAILIKGSIDAGGVKETWRIANENGRINLFNFDPDPTVRHTFWNLLVGTLIRGFGFMFNQSTIQRISATATVKDAKKMLFITAPAFTITLTCAAIEGIVVYAYYHTRGCDPLKSKQISNPNQLIPFMVMDIFHSLPGMPGLFIASLFSASLSTLSSGLSSMSALLYTDIIKPHTKPMSQFKATVIAKLAVVFFGALAVCVAFLISYVGGNLVQITGTLLAAFSGPLAGLFLLGCFVPFANAKGAILSALLSIGLTAWIAAGQFLTKVSRRWKKLPSAPIDQCFVNVNGTLDVFSNYTTSPTAYDATWSYDVTTSGGISEIPPAEGIAKLYTISYMWLGVIGILTVIIFGAIFSLMTGPVKPEDANPMYLVSFADKLMCYLPLSIRKRLRYGIDYEQAEKFHVEVDKLDEFVLKTEKEGMEVTYDEHLLSRLSGSGSDDIKCTLCEDPDSVEQFDTCNGDTQLETVNEQLALKPEAENRK